MFCPDMMLAVGWAVNMKNQSRSAWCRSGYSACSCPPFLLSSFMSIVLVPGARIACWLEHQTHDRKLVSSNPGRSSRRISSPELTLCAYSLIRCPFHPRVTALARKRLWSFCQKRRWQVTPKHALTFDLTKSECTDYAAAQA